MIPFLKDLPLKEIALVVLGGLFGWSLGKLPDKWVFIIITGAILLTLVAFLPR